MHVESLGEGMVEFFFKNLGAESEYVLPLLVMSSDIRSTTFSKVETFD